MTSDPARYQPPLIRALVPSLCVGTGIAGCALLALLPVVIPDATVPRFVSHGMIVALVVQILGAVAALAVWPQGPRRIWAARGAAIALSVGLIWQAGWHQDLWPGASVLLLALHLAASGYRAVALEWLLGATLVTAIAGIAHPLLVYDLVPPVLIATWGLGALTFGLWARAGLDLLRRDLAALAAVAALFAPTIMMLGGWFGHDTALLSSAVITQFVGILTARWVSFDQRARRNYALFQ